MFELIGGIFKYTLLTLAILVLSHIIEVQGVTISQHVLKTMHWVSGYSPKIEANRITADISRSMQVHVNELNNIRVDSEVSSADERALNHVIEGSQARKK